MSTTARDARTPIPDQLDPAPAELSEHDEKLARVHDLLDRTDADAIEFTSAASLAWLFCGARVTVPIGGSPVLIATVHRDRVVVTAHANEVERLVAEELPPGERELIVVPWHAGFGSGEADRDSGPGAGNRGKEGARALIRELDHESEVRGLRVPLTPHEVSRYEVLGGEVATAVTAVLRTARPEWTERALASELARAVVALGADPVVVLVGGSERVAVRHPLPTTALLGGRAVAVVGARRHGLYANLTRWIEFAADSAVNERDARLFEVETDTFAAMTVGRPIREVLDDIAASYVRHGFRADAWLGHHQGGPTGYFGRDPRATPTSDDVVAEQRAYAWNPSVPGSKVEDTVLLEPGGVRVLTVDADWPSTLVRGIARPLPITPDRRGGETGEPSC